MVGGQTGALGAASRGNARGTLPLSLATLEKQLHLRRRGREDGVRDAPATGMETLSETEHAIIAAVEAERRRLERLRQEEKADVERRLRGLITPPDDFAATTLEARLALKQIAGRLAHDWRQAADRTTQARTDLDAFKRANELRRAAVYPDSTLLQAGLLLCATVFEALFSAALFAEDDERGLLGGAITAMGLSGANVSLGFLAGFLGLRYLQHARFPFKAMGALGGGALTFLALMLNLFAADWRDQLAVLSGRQVEMGSDAGFHIWSLLQLSSPQAIILLMLGGGVWVFAAMKGYSGFDDPYPDYGKMDRALRDAAEALSDFRADAREELEAPVDQARIALNARMAKIRESYEAMSGAFDAAAQRIERLDANTRALDDAAAGAIHLYRQENIAARKTPPPKYFGEASPTLEPPPDVLVGAAALLDEGRDRLMKAQAAATQALESLLAELELMTAQFDEGAAA